MKYKLLIVDDNIGLANNISIFINKNIILIKWRLVMVRIVLTDEE